MSTQTRIVDRLFDTQFALSKDGLMGFVIRAVDDVDWPNKNQRFGLNQEERFPSRLLMILEVFCYARGLYLSEDVSGFAAKSGELKELFRGRFPPELVIQRFRRLHLDPIKLCLLRIFDLAFRVRFGEPETDEAPIDYCVTKSIDLWFEPICGPRPDEEADQRLDLASFNDNVLG